MLKKIAVALVAAGGLMVAAAPAHAGGHVSLSLGVGIPAVGFGYAAPAYAPSYYGPPAVAYAPAPAYAPAYAPVYAPAPYYVAPRYYGPGYYGPRVVYRPGPYYHGYREGYRGWHR